MMTTRTAPRPDGWTLALGIAALIPFLGMFFGVLALARGRAANRRARAEGLDPDGSTWAGMTLAVIGLAVWGSFFLWATVGLIADLVGLL